MKCVYFLFFVAVAQGFVVKPSQEKNMQLSAPTITRLTPTDDSLAIVWDKVVSSDSSEPVLGYVVKVWELQDEIVYVYKIVDGQLVLVEEIREATMDPNVIPTETPTELKVESADITNAVYKNFKYGVQYHVRVLAYTKNQMGPLSNAWGIKLAN